MSTEAPVEVSRPFGKFGKIPGADVDYCAGPEAIGLMPVRSRKFPYRWVFWQALDGVRMQRLDLFSGDEAGGDLTGLFDGASLSWVTACFDGVAEPVVATEDGPNVRLRKFEFGLPEEFVFTGRSPVVFFSGEVLYRVAEKEVVVFYLNASGTEIRVRRQLTGFATESVIAMLPYALSRLTKVDQKDQVVWIWGMTPPSNASRRGDVRQVAVRSEQYPPYPVVVGDDEGSLANSELFDGVHELVVPVITPVYEEQMSADCELESGVYEEMTVQADEDAWINAESGLEDGSHLDVIVAETPVEPSSPYAAATIFPGEYRQLIVRVTGLQRDSATASAGIVDGAYEEI